MKEEETVDERGILGMMLSEEKGTSIGRTDLAALLLHNLDALLKEGKRPVRLLLL